MTTKKKNPQHDNDNSEQIVHAADVHHCYRINLRLSYPLKPLFELGLLKR